MKSKERRIARKLTETCQKIDTVRNYLNFQVNNVSSKWKKHFPVSELSDKIINFEMDNDTNSITIQFENSTNNKYYCNNATWNKSLKKSADHSFSLSTNTPSENIDYIKNQLECIYNCINLILKRNLLEKLDKNTYQKYKCILDITSDFNKNNGTYFTKVFAINIFPILAFIYNNTQKTLKIATYYIIGYDGKNKRINIMFGHDVLFDTFHSGSRGLVEQIKKYNNKLSYHIHDIVYICDNLSLIAGECAWACDNNIYENKISEINKLRKINFIKTVSSDDEYAIIKELNKLNSKK